MKINIKEFTGNCSCGRNHQLVVDDVILEEGALKKLPEILNKEGNHITNISISLWYVMTILMRQQEKK